MSHSLDNYVPKHRAAGRRGNTMKKLAAWFTTARRQAIQVAAGSVAPILVFAGLITGAEATQWLIIFGAGLQAATNLLSLVNLRVGDLPGIYAVVRGAVYTAAATVAPALVSLNVVAPDLAEKSLTGIGLVLAGLGSIVAVMTSQRQVEDALKREQEIRAD